MHHIFEEFNQAECPMSDLPTIFNRGNPVQQASVDVVAAAVEASLAEILDAEILDVDSEIPDAVAVMPLPVPSPEGASAVS